MKRGSLILGIGLLPFLGGAIPAGAAAPAGQFQGLLQRVPPFPATADQPYAQWIDKNGDLNPGPAYTGLEQAVTAAEATLPGRQPISAATNALAQHYATPEGQAEIAKMTLAQKMALGQQMAAASMPAAPGAMVVTPHDQVLIRQITPYTGGAAMAAKKPGLINTKGQLETEWEKADQALDAQEIAANSKLPVCKGEAGEPSQLAVRDVARSYVPKHIALAAAYLGKYASLVEQYKALVMPEIANADSSAAAWNQLASPGLKQQLATGAAGAGGQAISEIVEITAFAEDGSKRAAQVVARKNAMERNFANAKGC